MNGSSIYWDPEPAAGGHDVVWGSLRALRDSRGDFTAAVSGCLADNAPGDLEGAFPGSFDSGSPAQAAPSDDSILASPAACL